MRDSSPRSARTSDLRPSGRRVFLRRVVLGGAGGLALAAPGCTPPVRTLRLRRPGPVRLRLDRWPELAHPGGRVRILAPGHGPAWLVRLEGGSLVAVSGTCTHQGCAVRGAGSGFRCPCHGSRFAADGRRLGGPAPRALPRLPLRRETGGAVIVHLPPSREARRPGGRGSPGIRSF